MRFRRGFRTAAVAIATALCVPASAVDAGTPDAWAWKHRLLVVFAADEGDPALAQQRRKLTRFKDGLLERDMSVVEVLGGKANTRIGPDLKLNGSALETYAGTDGSTFEVMLFGKDTGLKLRSRDPVSANDLFSLIDRMPMRREEMRRGG